MSDRLFNTIIAVPFFILMAICFYDALRDESLLQDAISLRNGVMEVYGKQ